MIHALIFDLDGTLVLTEPLKALSHARCVLQISGDHLTEADVVEAVKDLTGIPHPETLWTLVQRFGLENAARQRARELGFEDALEFLISCDQRAYASLVSDPKTLRSVRSPQAIAVLRAARRRGLKIGLATMAPREEVQYVLHAIGLNDVFDCVATLDAVQRGKPDPEIYLYVARDLGVAPGECIVLEDTVPGVQGALAAGMHCIAVPNSFTADSFDRQDVLDERWVVRDPAQLERVVQQMLEWAKAGDAGGSRVRP